MTSSKEQEHQKRYSLYDHASELYYEAHKSLGYVFFSVVIANGFIITRFERLLEKGIGDATCILILGILNLVFVVIALLCMIVYRIRQSIFASKTMREIREDTKYKKENITLYDKNEKFVKGIPMFLLSFYVCSFIAFVFFMISIIYVYVEQ